MKFYRIKGSNNAWGLVNLQRIILVDFDDESSEIVFDNILHVKVDRQDYAAIRKGILKRMFKKL